MYGLPSHLTPETIELALDQWDNAMQSNELVPPSAYAVVIGFAQGVKTGEVAPQSIGELAAMHDALIKVHEHEG